MEIARIFFFPFHSIFSTKIWIYYIFFSIEMLPEPQKALDGLKKLNDTPTNVLQTIHNNLNTALTDSELIAASVIFILSQFIWLSF